MNREVIYEAYEYQSGAFGQGSEEDNDCDNELVQAGDSVYEVKTGR